MFTSGQEGFPLALPVGTRLEHYEIQGILGAGAFGVTYRAHSHRFHKDCVIKELLPVDYATRNSQQRVVPLSESAALTFEKCRKDFEREATVLHSVNHANVVKILDFLRLNGTYYFVMPYASGKNLERFLVENLAQRPCREEETLRFLERVLGGLECVHAKGYLHRDIKPENIIITDDGEPLLIDFGAARQLIGSRSRAMSMILTRHYAPNEQYSSTKKQGPYTDIYALGAVVHRMMLGEPPAEAPDRMDEDESTASLAVRLDGKGYSRQFLEAIDGALKFKANARPQTIAEWRLELPARATTLRPSSKRPPEPSDPAPPPSSRSVPPPLPPQDPFATPNQHSREVQSIKKAGVELAWSPTKIGLFFLAGFLFLTVVCYLLISALAH